LEKTGRLIRAGGRAIDTYTGRSSRTPILSRDAHTGRPSRAPGSLENTIVARDMGRSIRTRGDWLWVDAGKQRAGVQCY